MTQAQGLLSQHSRSSWMIRGARTGEWLAMYAANAPVSSDPLWATPLTLKVTSGLIARTRAEGLGGARLSRSPATAARLMPVQAVEDEGEEALRDDAWVAGEHVEQFHEVAGADI